jgi:hypothetical protein
MRGPDSVRPPRCSSEPVLGPMPPERGANACPPPVGTPAQHRLSSLQVCDAQSEAYSVVHGHRRFYRSDRGRAPRAAQGRGRHRRVCSSDHSSTPVHSTKISPLLVPSAGRYNSKAFRPIEVNGMARAVSEIEREIRALEPDDQEHLLRALLEELDGPPDPGVEQA